MGGISRYLPLSQWTGIVPLGQIRLNPLPSPRLALRSLSTQDRPTANRETFYGGANQGYTDYPLLRGVEPHACYCDAADRAWG